MFDSVFTKCSKCNGQGTIDAYYYVNNGVCFKCGGSGKINTATQKPAEELSAYQWECINKAKKQLESVGYYDMTDALSEIDFMQLTDIMIQHKQLLETRAKDMQQTNDENWFNDLFEIA